MPVSGKTLARIGPATARRQDRIIINIFLFPTHLSTSTVATRERNEKMIGKTYVSEKMQTGIKSPIQTTAVIILFNIL